MSKLKIVVDKIKVILEENEVYSDDIRMIADYLYDYAQEVNKKRVILFNKEIRNFDYAEVKK